MTVQTWKLNKKRISKKDILQVLLLCQCSAQREDGTRSNQTFQCTVHLFMSFLHHMKSCLPSFFMGNILFGVNIPHCQLWIRGCMFFYDGLVSSMNSSKEYFCFQSKLIKDCFKIMMAIELVKQKTYSEHIQRNPHVSICCSM